MTDLAADILAALHAVAPEVDPATVDRRTPLTDQLDLDSMDYVRFLSALSARHHVDIPDADVPRLRTIDEIAAYLATSKR
jgi:acyl carrier protein